jgi:hypothetical protein
LENLPRPGSFETGYTLQDGVIASEGLGNAAVDGDGPTLPGNVNVIDVEKANALVEQMAGKGKGKGGSKAYRTKVEPQWFANNTKFWYRNDTKDGTKDFVLVDVEHGTRGPAFDHEKLAASLSNVKDVKYASNQLPFQTIEFVDGGKAVRFGIDGKFWQCDLTSYECKPGTSGPVAELDEYQGPPVDEPRDWFHNSYEPLFDDELSPEERLEQKGGKQQKGAQEKGGGKQPGPAASKESKSPDGNWTAFVKERNVWLRDKDGRESQMTKNGVDGVAFGALTWSPDS